MKTFKCNREGNPRCRSINSLRLYALRARVMSVSEDCEINNSQKPSPEKQATYFSDNTPHLLSENRGVQLGLTEKIHSLPLCYFHIPTPLQQRGTTETEYQCISGTKPIPCPEISDHDTAVLLHGYNTSCFIMTPPLIHTDIMITGIYLSVLGVAPAKTDTAN